MRHRRSRILIARIKGLTVLPALLLTASLAPPAASASSAADLAITLNQAGIAVYGGSMAYTITATNQGPDTAANVVINDHTPSNIWAAHPTVFECVGSGTGWCGTPLAPGVSCTTPPPGSPGLVSCTTASLAPGASMTITIVIRVGFYLHNSVISDTATTSSSTFDPNTANNTASVWARVN
jgi:uncharacterized repeat protein (TIGR01451 family)